jgi:hypothetical protein
LEVIPEEEEDPIAGVAVATGEEDMVSDEDERGGAFNGKESGDGQRVSAESLVTQFSDIPFHAQVAPKSSSDHKEDMVSHRFIFGVIFSRCRDVAATVRAKALQTLAEITASNNATMALVIKDLFRQDEAVVKGKKKA